MSTTYRIAIQGHLGATTAARFAGFTIEHRSDGTTVATGTLADQAALHGAIKVIRDLGLELISLATINEEEDT